MTKHLFSLSLICLIGFSITACKKDGEMPAASEAVAPASPDAHASHEETHASPEATESDAPPSPAAQ